MAQISEWLQVMLAEIARKREDGERAREEDVKRTAEKKVAASHADVALPTRIAGAAQR
jgi:hypothetical protein